MKKYLINSLIILLILILPILVVATSEMIQEFLVKRLLNVSSDWTFPMTFIFLFIVSAFSYTKFIKRVGFIGVTIPLILFILIFILLFLYLNTFKFTIKLSPVYITMLLAIIAGYYYSVKSNLKLKIPLLLLIFPLAMSMGLNELWVHKIEYGNFYGNVKNPKIVAFEMTNKAGELVSNETLKGNYVLFDYWFIGCPPCWDKFPELQRIYEKYQSQPNVKIFAVNRPMRRDEPEEMYSSIEEKNYTFPVLAGTQEIMDAFSVYKYPTVVLLNKKGEMVFMGEIEEAEIKLESFLNSEN